MAIPVRYNRSIFGHSGLANVHGITVHNGLIDLNYCGSVCMVLFNLYNYEFVVETGNCNAQLIIKRCFTPEFVEINLLRRTLRWERGIWVLWVYDVSFISAFKKVN